MSKVMDLTAGLMDGYCNITEDPAVVPTKEKFRNELEVLLNRHCMENGSNTPDFQLADYLIMCLDALDVTINKRTAWYAPKG